MKKILFSLFLLPALTVPAFAETVYNADGTVRYTDGAASAVSGVVSEFLTKPFEQYSVTEGFLLLFLLLGIPAGSSAPGIQRRRDRSPVSAVCLLRFDCTG